MTSVAAGALRLRCGRLERLLGAGGNRRCRSLRGPRRAIGVDGNGERLVEVVETISGVGSGGNCGRLDPLGALRPGKRSALVASELERVDSASAAQPRRRHDGAVTEHGECGAPSERDCRSGEVGRNPDALQQAADSAARVGIDVDG